MKRGDILSLSTRRNLWVVASIEPWTPHEYLWEKDSQCVKLHHAHPEDRAKWPGFVDTEALSVIEAIATVCEVEEHLDGHRWVILPEGSPVEPEAVRPDGTGLVCIEHPRGEEEK